MNRPYAQLRRFASPRNSRPEMRPDSTPFLPGAVGGSYQAGSKPSSDARASRDARPHAARSAAPATVDLRPNRDARRRRGATGSPSRAYPPAAERNATRSRRSARTGRASFVPAEKPKLAPFLPSLRQHPPGGKSRTRRKWPHSRSRSPFVRDLVALVARRRITRFGRDYWPQGQPSRPTISLIASARRGRSTDRWGWPFLRSAVAECPGLALLRIRSVSRGA